MFSEWHLKLTDPEGLVGKCPLENFLRKIIYSFMPPFLCRVHLSCEKGIHQNHLGSNRLGVCLSQAR